MDPKHIARLRALTDFPALVNYLRDELDWPIEVEDADDLVFDYDPAELGIDPRHAVKIESIKQIRPLADNQPWGLFYVEFESKRLPVVVLRRILRTLVPASRARDPDRPAWRMSDLLFISAQGEPGQRGISFAHFRRRQPEGHLPELRTFSWDTRETHFYYLKNLNLEALRWPEDEDDTHAWRERWSRAFAVEHRYTITTSQMLAREMARQAAVVRDLVSEVYALEGEDHPLHQLYTGFKEVLLHDLDPEDFADMIAQTVAYGLFSAATQTSDLTFDRVVELIPNTNPFLRDLLAELTAYGAVDLDELGVGQLVELLRQTDVEAILQDFGRQTGGGREDPEVNYLSPLYLYPTSKNVSLFEHQEPTDAPGGRHPNFDSDFLTDLSQRLGLKFTPDGSGDLQTTFGPEDIFHYIYAILHSPTYRERCAEFLKIDFPRVPLTSDLDLFRALAALHLLEDDYPAASWNQAGQASPLQHPITTFVEGFNGTTMGAFSKRACYEDGRVYLDTSQRKRSSYFDGVPEDVWNFHIGGYQVCYKWLYDRRGTKGEPGRTLSEADIAHYQRVVVALKETMRLMAEIDEAIEGHGGWPVE